MKLKSKRQIIKLFKGPITKIVQDPTDPQRIIAAGFDGTIKFVNLSPFQLCEEFRAFPQFCTSICVVNDSIFAGSSSGELVHLSMKGEVVKKFKLYQDCLSSILISDSFIITTGFDGVVLFLNKANFQIQKKVQLKIPIWSSEYFENKIYVASNPSFSIDCSTYEVKPLKRFDSFAIFNKKVYASSDERGLTCLKNNSNSYIPCNFILPLEDRMMIFSEQCATQIIHEHQMQWKCHRIKQIQKGSSITSGCYIGKQIQSGYSNNGLQNLIILGDNMGQIYRLEFNILKNSLRDERLCDANQ